MRDRAGAYGHRPDARRGNKRCPFAAAGQGGPRCPASPRRPTPGEDPQPRSPMRSLRHRRPRARPRSPPAASLPQPVPTPSAPCTSPADHRLWAVRPSRRSQKARRRSSATKGRECARRPARRPSLLPPASGMSARRGRAADTRLSSGDSRAPGGWWSRPQVICPLPG